MKNNFALIVDTGLSNLHSIQAACSNCRINFKVSSSPSDLKASGAIILPGVGSFAKAVKNLKELKIFDLLREEILKEKPTLGICLGMQLLLNESEEFGLTEGLSVIPGKVKKFDLNKINYSKIPHIGWNSIINPKNSWRDTILESVNNLDKMYFIHSYFVKLKDQNQILSETQYGNFKFCSSLRYKNIYATQFHPEKSGTNGLKILKEFKKIFKL